MTILRLPSVLAAAVVLVLALPATAGEPVDVTGRDHIVEGLIPVTGAERDLRRVALRIGFDLNSARLTPVGRRQLDELAAALQSRRLAQARFGLYGHTDASGPAAYNLRLSQQRARSVRDYLVAEAGIDPRRLEAKGFGEDRLRPDLAPGAAGQRRVEVVNLTPERVQPPRPAKTPAEDAAAAPAAATPAAESPAAESPAEESGTSAITE